MDWNRLVLIGAQCVVFVSLAGLVALGHDSTITDAMLAISGSIIGIGAYTVVKKTLPPS